MSNSTSHLFRFSVDMYESTSVSLPMNTAPSNIKAPTHKKWGLTFSLCRWLAFRNKPQVSDERHDNTLDVRNHKCEYDELMAKLEEDTTRMNASYTALVPLMCSYSISTSKGVFRRMWNSARCWSQSLVPFTPPLLHPAPQ